MKETDVRDSNTINNIGSKHLIDYSKGVPSYYNMTDIPPLFQGVLSLFGSNQKAFDAAGIKLTTDAAMLISDKKNIDKEIGRGQGRKWDYTFKNQKDVELLMDDADKMVEILDNTIASHKENSFPWRILSALKKHMEFIFSPEYMDIQQNDSHLEAFVNNFNDFPTPEFVKGYDDENKPIYEIDFNRYEEFMKKHEEFLLQFEDRQNFLINTYVPYMAKKKAGTITEHDEIMFKKDYYEHLKRQAKYWDTIKYKYEWDDLKDIAPFASNEKQFTMDWQGERGADPVLNWVHDEIHYLERGWSPEDIPFLQDIQKIRNDIGLPEEEGTKKQTPNDGWGKDRAKFQRVYEKFHNTQVTSAKIRKELINSMKPFIKKYNSMMKNQVYDSALKGIEKVENNEVSIINLSEEERVRQEMIKSLTDIKKRLNTGRMGINHASEEMQALRNSLDKLIKKLIERRSGLDSITSISTGRQNNPYQRLFEEVAKKAKDYKDKKRSDAGAAADNKEWKPKTDMGKARFDAANELEKLCGDYKKKIGRMTEKEALRIKMSYKKNINTIYEGDLSYMYKDAKPYEVGVVVAMNYFSKKPCLIPEHCANKGSTFTLEEFERQCKPYELLGISNEEFALVAFAAIYDHRNLSPEFFEKYKRKDIGNPTKTISNYEIAKNRRAMYIDDYFKIQPRADIGKIFNDYTLVPAREKAFNVLSDYKNTGNLDGLSEVFVVGIKELNRECIECSHISGPNSKVFAVKTEMLKRMLDYIEKKPALYEKVTGKLGPEIMEEVKDYLRLKSFRDKSLEAEKKLESAVKNNKPLSEAEKNECIRDIVKFELLENVRTNALEEMALANKPLQDFLPKYEKLIKDSFRKKNDFTAEEISTYRNTLELNARKSVYKVTKALRTEEGLNDLDKCVDKMAGKLSIDKPVKELLADIKAFKMDLSNNTVEAKNAAAKRKENNLKRSEELKGSKTSTIGPRKK